MLTGLELRKMVSIDSIFPKERALAIFLESQLKERGFTTKRIPIPGSRDRFNVVGERGLKGKSILLYGHMDTVPVYGKWGGDPFTMREHDDHLHGIGIYDMKAGLAAILAACEGKSQRRIKVAFGVDEENVSEGAWAIAKSGFLDDVEAIVVPEINDSPQQTPKGAVPIMLGRRGRAVYEIHVPGRSSHGAHIEDGISAISEAARLVLELERLNAMRKTHPKLPPPTQFIRKIYGESTSLSLPDTAVIELDRHLVTPETPESVLKELRGFIADLYSRKIFNEIDGRSMRADIRPRKTPYLAPYVTEVSSPIVKRLAASVEKEGGRPFFNYGASVADENVFASKGIPVVSLGPEGAAYHAADEWVSRASFERLIRIYSGFVSSL
jgi:succinyl-diaminopimelate desuccinylase